MEIKLNKKKVDCEIKSRLDALERANNYYKKRITDVKPINIIGKAYAYTYTEYELENNQYFFSEFKHVEIGEKVAINEDDYLVIEGKTINYCIFESCKFQHIKFVRCNFTGCRFINVNFYRTVFEECYFSTPIAEPGFNTTGDIFYVLTIFEKCIFLSDFMHCNLENGYYEKCSFTLVKYYNCNMKSLYMDTCAFSSVDIRDSDLSCAKFYHTDIFDIEISDDKCTKVNEETFFDYKIYAKRPQKGEMVQTESGWKKDNYDEMILEKSKTLRRVANLYEKNGYSSFSGEYFYRSKLVERKSIHGLKKMISTCGLLLCGYGERPLFTFVSIIVTILAFGFFYLFTGFKIDDTEYGVSQIIETWPNVLQIIKYYGHSVFFSITTFSTVGYGNYVPVGGISSFLAAIQMIVGVSLSALWTGCIFKKISR